MPERRDSERRGVRASWHWPERRTGFDRRRSYPLSGLIRSDQRYFAALLVLILVLGVLDWALTYNALTSLGAVEGNPLMRAAYDAGPGAALALKLTSLAAVVAGMWWLRHYRSVIVLAVAAAGLHVVLVGYHVAGVAILS
ncbi:MAG: hypothetical protein K0B85_06405 [Coriobacteriia bacterium]|nr:hypothetical protein [Coriobacteriia bacterium]